MRNTEAQYRAEWAAKTGKSEREIYVPEALRERVDYEEALANGEPLETFEEFILDAVQGGLDRRG